MSQEISPNVQEYLEVIYALTRGGGKATVTAISERLGIAPASATEMLRKLAEKGYVSQAPYHGATLTETGFRIGQKVSRKHRLLERFLHDVLRLGRGEVHKQACEMEHTLSDEAERALCQFLGHPDKCPDDSKPIQACDLELSSCEECVSRRDEGLERVGKRQRNLVCVADLGEKDIGRVAFIRGDNKVLRRLLDMGLTSNTVIKVVRVAPLGGPIEIAVRGSRLALGHEIASDVFVEMVEAAPSGAR